MRRDSFLLNSNGRIAQRFSIPAAAVTYYVRDDYKYDAAGLLAAIDRYYNGAFSNTISYKWENGDMVQESSSDEVIYYKYDTTRAWQFGMFNSLTDYLFFGLPKYRLAHLQIQDSIVQPGMFGIYFNRHAYSFDSDGKIICATATGTQPLYVNTYNYDCK